WTDIAMVADHAMMTQHCPGAQTCEASNARLGLHGRAGADECPHSHLHIGGDNSTRMNHATPTLIWNAEPLNTLHPARHVLDLLYRRNEKDILVEFRPILKPPEDRHALKDLAARQSIIEEADQRHRLTCRNRRVHGLGNHHPVSRSSENGDPLH